MSATTDYELRFLDTRGARVFTRVTDRESDKAAIAAIGTTDCPVTYSRVEVWRGFTKVHTGPRMAASK